MNPHPGEDGLPWSAIADNDVDALLAFTGCWTNLGAHDGFGLEQRVDGTHLASEGTSALLEPFPSQHHQRFNDSLQSSEQLTNQQRIDSTYLPTHGMPTADVRSHHSQIGYAIPQELPDFEAILQRLDFATAPRSNGQPTFTPWEDRAPDTPLHGTAGYANHSLHNQEPVMFYPQAPRSAPEPTLGPNCTGIGDWPDYTGQPSARGYPGQGDLFQFQPQAAPTTEPDVDDTDLLPPHGEPDATSPQSLKSADKKRARRTHNRYYCAICEVRSQYPKDSVRHLGTKKHRMKAAELDDPNQPLEQGFPVYCPFCNKEYTRKDNRDRHVRNKHKLQEPAVVVVLGQDVTPENHQPVRPRAVTTSTTSNHLTVPTTPVPAKRKRSESSAAALPPSPRVPEEQSYNIPAQGHMKSFHCPSVQASTFLPGGQFPAHYASFDSSRPSIASEGSSLRPRWPQGHNGAVTEDALVTPDSTTYSFEDLFSDNIASYSDHNSTSPFAATKMQRWHSTGH